MADEERYTKATKKLAAQEYQVLPNNPGFIVRHIRDPNDISLARNLDELVELAELFERAFGYSLNKRYSLELMLPSCACMVVPGQVVVPNSAAYVVSMPN